MIFVNSTLTQINVFVLFKMCTLQNINKKVLNICDSLNLHRFGMNDTLSVCLKGSLVLRERVALNPRIYILLRIKDPGTVGPNLFFYFFD